MINIKEPTVKKLLFGVQKAVFLFYTKNRPLQRVTIDTT